MKGLLISAIRLHTLTTLAKLPQYKTNHSVIRDALAQQYGLVQSSDQVRTQLCWLEEQELVELERLGEKTVVATLTEKGLEVSQGLTSVDGVKRPMPSA